MRTRAAIYVEFQKPLVVEEIELPDPGPTQLLIKQFASGICHSQLHALHNPKTLTPRLMGHESTGVVVGAGSNVTHVKEGDHVMVTFLPRSTRPGTKLPVPVLKWRDQEISSHGNNSTWAEAIVADASFVVPLDHSAPTDVTAVIGCAVMTGCGAVLNSARVQPGDSVVVIGVGGVGLAAVQAAANVSAHPIIAVDVDDAKLVRGAGKWVLDLWPRRCGSTTFAGRSLSRYWVIAARRSTGHCDRRSSWSVGWRTYIRPTPTWIDGLADFDSPLHPRMQRAEVRQRRASLGVNHGARRVSNASTQGGRIAVALLCHQQRIS